MFIRWGKWKTAKKKNRRSDLTAPAIKVFSEKTEILTLETMREGLITPFCRLG